VMFGALAASESLPFPRDAFEEAIRHGGKAIESNLKGFELGFDRARNGDPAAAAPAGPPAPTTEAGRALLARIEAELPESARPVAIEGVRRLMDYQDRAYADLYLSRLAPIAALDGDGRMTSEAARHLALWMAYEDTIRVADLKVRATRSARVAKEVRLAPGQVMTVTEYMHPRLREMCETLPAAIGAFILRSPRLSRWLEPLFRRGRHVETTGLRWFLALRLLASLRTIRRSTLRYREEQARIEDWLAFVQNTARNDPEAATELLRCQELIKGYSDTFERGLANFETVTREARSFAGQPDAADRIRLLREAAFADDDGKALGCVLASDAA
ncbi:MAG: indolepyruvate oxidoreductase subunit beta family protein, partial [Proteobacteria bacterium]|nr:indolepyruvate oxidoreductase subunit beta family protein [Pseudomonadota bacterium]